MYIKPFKTRKYRWDGIFDWTYDWIYYWSLRLGFFAQCVADIHTRNGDGAGFSSRFSELADQGAGVNKRAFDDVLATTDNIHPHSKCRLFNRAE